VGSKLENIRGPDFQTLFVLNSKGIIVLPCRQNQSVRLTNIAFLDNTMNCSPDIHNLTLEDNKFKFASNHREVVFLQNCSEQGKRSFMQYIELSHAFGRDNNQSSGNICKRFGEFNWQVQKGGYSSIQRAK